MSQHHFSHKIEFLDSATEDHHIQPLSLLSNLKSMHDYQPICLTNTKIMKSICTRQLPNLQMLDSDFNKTQISPNINNVSLFSLEKLRDDNYGKRLTKNQ